MSSASQFSFGAIAIPYAMEIRLAKGILAAIEQKRGRMRNPSRREFLTATALAGAAIEVGEARGLVELRDTSNKPRTGKSYLQAVQTIRG